jgi:hypothetical protein
MEFMDISSLGATYRYAVKIEQKLAAKTRKGRPQPIEQRTEKIWTVSGQPVQAASKEGHWKDKHGYQEVVKLP